MKNYNVKGYNGDTAEEFTLFNGTLEECQKYAEELRAEFIAEGWDDEIYIEESDGVTIIE